MPCTAVGLTFPTLLLQFARRPARFALGLRHCFVYPPARPFVCCVGFLPRCVSALGRCLASAMASCASSSTILAASVGLVLCLLVLGLGSLLGSAIGVQPPSSLGPARRDCIVVFRSRVLAYVGE